MITSTTSTKSNGFITIHCNTRWSQIVTLISAWISGNKATCEKKRSYNVVIQVPKIEKRYNIIVLQKGHIMSLISILDKIESKAQELEDKKDEIQQQIRDLSALEYTIQDKINEDAEDISETRRNMIMEGIADIEGLLMEAGFSEEEAMDVDENMEVTEAIQEAEWNY